MHGSDIASWAANFPYGVRMERTLSLKQTRRRNAFSDGFLGPSSGWSQGASFSGQRERACVMPVSTKGAMIAYPAAFG